MQRQQNTPNFRVRVFVYHPETDEYITDYTIDQVIARKKGNFDQTTKACYDCVEAAQSVDGLRYVCYFPIYESWVQGGNRLIESTLGA